MVAKLDDVLSIHPYWVHNDSIARKDAYEKKLDDAVAFARRAGKPIVASECRRGSLDDKVRVESIRYTLTQLEENAASAGWCTCCITA